MTDTPPADTFADLAALAAKGPDGTLWLTEQRKWSYPGAPRPDANTSSLRLPENVDDQRVQAALAAAAWMPWYTDPKGKVVAVIVTTRNTDGSLPPPRSTNSFGAVDRPLG